MAAYAQVHREIQQHGRKEAKALLMRLVARLTKKDAGVIVRKIAEGEPVSMHSHRFSIVVHKWWGGRSDAIAILARKLKKLSYDLR